MKKTILILSLMALCIVLVALPTFAAETPTDPVTEGVSWRGYTLKAIRLTTDAKDINIPNLRTDGQFAMMRFVPAEGIIAKNSFE